MLYAGKRPEELTSQELEAAEEIVRNMLTQANAVYEANRIAYLELSEEQTRRATAARKMN